MPEEKKHTTFRIKGLQRRWLLNTVGVVFTLGLVCVLAITAVFAGYHYTSMESDLYYRARATSSLLNNYMNQEYDAFYLSCINYVETMADHDDTQLQFLRTDGQIVASTSPQSVGQIIVSTDISGAIQNRAITPCVGQEEQTGKRIMSMSVPVIYSNGEVIGVLRFVTATRSADLQILLVAGICLLALLLIAAIVLLSSNYYLRSILVPLAEIIEKAKRITNGSYGIQISTKYDDEIGELADTINEMSIKINQNEKMQTEFISSLSHELRTPLTAITGWSETLLSNEHLDRETSRGMKIILREAKRLTEMVVDLLDFTRIQDGRMTLNMELTDIRSEFEDTVYMYSSRLQQDGITLEYLDSDEEIPEISCDPKRLRQVFLNILDNAAKHGGDGKRIEASISCEEDTVIFTIRDFGSGIPEDELPLVKHKFYKGSSKARGTGIGLAMCEEIVQLHSGSMTLENATGGGTLVTVRLPLSI